MKARPTPRQLADRWQDPRPEGLELYLDANDISAEGWIGRLRALIEEAQPASSIEYVVEGPLRSLDGSFFDLTQDSEANRETLRRLTALGQVIGARLAVIHCIAPVPVAQAAAAEPRVALERTRPLLDYYGGLCRERGLVPTVENIPPVARMREGQYLGSLIGVRPSDLRWVVERVEGLYITLDLSHAQLYVNAARGGSAETPELTSLVATLEAGREAENLTDYITTIEDRIANVHVSNASGLLGEGLPYGEGDANLDAAVRRLAPIASFLVTETVEPDPDRAVYMREAQRRIQAALG